jgi:pimeloyl-ACP methyl ester carboxylesterase
LRGTHDVIAVDLPGFGRSDRIDGELTLELYVRWLERFVTELGLAPVAIVGNCVGSLSALHLAARHPRDVSALVLMHTLTAEVNAAGANGPGTRFAQLPGMYPVARYLMRHMPRWRQRRFPYPRAQFGPVGNATGSDYREHAFSCFADPETRVAQVSMVPDIANWVLPDWERVAGRPPICWIWGDSNRLLPLDAGRRQLDVLKPEEVHILEGCGYAAAWEVPEKVNAIIERFLERHRVLALADGRRLDVAHIAFP